MRRLHCRTCDQCVIVLSDTKPYISRHSRDFCNEECLQKYLSDEENNVKEVVMLMHGHEVRVMVDADTGERIF